MNTAGKKLLIGGIIVLLLGGYALWASTRSTVPTTADTATQSTDQTNGQTSASHETTNPNASNTGVDNGIGDSSSPSDVQSTGGLKDGVYTGAVGSAAPYGQVQVRATISGGKLTNITVIEMPQGPGETNEISARTFPILVQEAISIQSAKVHIVSGATQDSEGFQQSLGSALAQAQS